MKGASKELQEYCLVGLVNDVNLLSKCVEEITEDYFANPHYKLLYKCVKNFYNKFLTIPNKNELNLYLDTNYSEDYGIKGEIYESILNIYNQPLPAEEFVWQQSIEFIQRVKIEKALEKILMYYDNGKGDIDLNLVATELDNSVHLDIKKSAAINLADITKIKEVRENALGDTKNPMIIKCFIDDLNHCFQYRGFIPGTLNMITAPPGRGKTTFLINQGTCAARQEFNVLHVFLGDMSEHDGRLRYLSCYTGTNTEMLVQMSDGELELFTAKHNMEGKLRFIDVKSYAADELTINQLIEEIKRLQKLSQKHYDLVMIDYDENLVEEGDSMYKSGGNVYNRAALFANKNKSVLFIASQPKPDYWDKEMIPLQAASESSKKQKIIDIMLTLGSSDKTSVVGTLFIAKNRRGIDGQKFRIKKNGANAQMTHISDDVYNTIKSKENNKA